MKLALYKNLVRRILPRKMKRHRIRRGTLKGSFIYTSWHDYPGAILGTTERPLLEWFAKHTSPGETWLDVGAHYGYTAIALSRLVKETGRVFAFEPMLPTAACVAQTRRLNGLTGLSVIPLGLSADTGIETRRLSVVRGMADSTISQEGWREAILVCALDGLWPTLSEASPRIHGIKIDVQAMEYEALKGMRQTLAAHRPKLAIEFHQGVDRGQILDLLKECGYPNPGQPIDAADAGLPLYSDDKSYAFLPGA